MKERIDNFFEDANGFSPEGDLHIVNALTNSSKRGWNNNLAGSGNFGEGTGNFANGFGESFR